MSFHSVPSKGTRPASDSQGCSYRVDQAGQPQQQVWLSGIQTASQADSNKHAFLLRPDMRNVASGDRDGGGVLRWPSVSSLVLPSRTSSHPSLLPEALPPVPFYSAFTVT